MWKKMPCTARLPPVSSRKRKTPCWTVFRCRPWQSLWGRTMHMPCANFRPMPKPCLRSAWDTSALQQPWTDRGFPSAFPLRHGNALYRWKALPFPVIPAKQALPIPHMSGNGLCRPVALSVIYPPSACCCVFFPLWPVRHAACWAKRRPYTCAGCRWHFRAGPNPPMPVPQADHAGRCA